MKNSCLILVVLLLVSCDSSSQSKSDEAVLESESVDVQEGYGAGDVVYHGYLDNSGTMWFATSQEGVYKFDGQTFTNYNTENGLCGNDISTVIEDNDGNIWFGGRYGLLWRYDGETLEDFTQQKRMQ